MNELQIGLLAIGAIVVVAVLAYNKWQERRYRAFVDERMVEHMAWIIPILIVRPEQGRKQKRCRA